MNLPTGTILIWTGGEPPLGWETLDSAYNSKPIKGYSDNTFSHSTPTANSGSVHSHTMASTSSSTTNTHTHTIDGGSSVGLSGNPGQVDCGITGSNKLVSAASHGHGDATVTVNSNQNIHSHSFTVSISNATVAEITPPYKTAILIIKKP